MERNVGEEPVSEREGTPVADETQSFDKQLTAAFDELVYPIEDETDLAPNFPSWANTRFESPAVTLTPRELLVLVPDEYPYEDVDELVAAITTRLREEGYVE